MEVAGPLGTPLGLAQRESEQTLGDSEGQGSLECCSPWGREELDHCKPFSS